MQSLKSLDKMPATSLDFRVGRVTHSVPRTFRWRALVACLLAQDAILIGLAFLAAYYLRFGASVPLFRLEVLPAYDYYRELSFALVPMWLAIFVLNGLYDRTNLLGGTQEYARVFRSATVGMMAVVIFSFLEPDFVLARGWLLSAWLLAFLFVAVGRFSTRRMVYALRRRGYMMTSALIVGASDEGRLFAKQFQGNPTSGLVVAGFVDDRFAQGMAVEGELYCLGGIKDMDRLIAQYQVEEIILATSSLSQSEIVTVFKNYGLVDNLNLRLSSGLFGLISTGLEVTDTSSSHLMRVRKVQLNGIDRAIKFALDYAIAIPNLIIMSPILAGIAVAVKLDSRGPILHRRLVMGINGRTFHAYKFRTMHVNGDEILARYPELQAELAANHKLMDDPRITRVGRFLRKYSLDEVPQLLNVLRREMTLVGPRMISPEEMAKYDKWGLNLLTVLPGITGLWQVSGRSDISYEERVQLDMEYIRNWTPWLDLQIIWQTIPVVLHGKGAY
jgi:exopolysaccharide biosynthesis polyprenyl glycosylphosphotransferase